MNNGLGARVPFVTDKVKLARTRNPTPTAAPTANPGPNPCPDPNPHPHPNPNPDPNPNPNPHPHQVYWGHTLNEKAFTKLAPGQLVNHFPGGDIAEI